MFVAHGVESFYRDERSAKICEVAHANKKPQGMQFEFSSRCPWMTTIKDTLAYARLTPFQQHWEEDGKRWIINSIPVLGLGGVWNAMHMMIERTVDNGPLMEHRQFINALGQRLRAMVRLWGFKLQLRPRIYTGDW